MRNNHTISFFGRINFRTDRRIFGIKQADRRAHAYMGQDVRLLEQEAIYAAELDEPPDLPLIEALLDVLERRRNE